MVLRRLKPPIRAAGGRRNVQDYRFSALGVLGNERVLENVRAHSISPDTAPPGEPPQQTALTTSLHRWFSRHHNSPTKLSSLQIRNQIHRIRSPSKVFDFVHFTLKFVSYFSGMTMSAQRYGPQKTRPRVTPPPPPNHPPPPPPPHEQ